MPSAASPIRAALPSERARSGQSRRAVCARLEQLGADRHERRGAQAGASAINPKRQARRRDLPRARRRDSYAALPVYLREQGDFFYWISGDYGEPGYVYRRLRDAPTDDAGTRIVDVVQGTAATISGFAVTTDAIYWVTSDDANAGTTDNDIRTTPLTGGVPTSVPKVAGATDAVIKDFGNFTISPSLTAVGDTLYFARTIGETTLNGVYRFNKGDAAPTKIAEAENVTTFAVGDAWVYYGLLAQQGVWRAPLTGGQGVKVGQNYQTTIVGVDDTFAYVAFVNQPSYFYKIFQ